MYSYLQNPSIQEVAKNTDELKSIPTYSDGKEYYKKLMAFNDADSQSLVIGISGSFHNNNTGTNFHLFIDSGNDSSAGFTDSNNKGTFDCMVEDTNLYKNQQVG